MITGQKYIAGFLLLLVATLLFSQLATIVAKRSLDNDLQSIQHGSVINETYINTYGTNKTLTDYSSQDDFELTSSLVSNLNTTWLEFDGANDYIINTYDNLSNTDFSLSVWFNSDLVKHNWESTLNNSALLWFQDDSPSLVFYNGSFSNIYLKLQIVNYTGGISSNSLSYNITDTTLGWHYASAVFKSGTRNMTLYYDGFIVASKIVTDGNMQNGNNFYIGRDDNIRYFNGSIDEVRVYNTTLNTSDVTIIYDQGRTLNKNILNVDKNTAQVFYASFNENEGSTLYDISGHGNDGTITGATYNNDGINLTLVSNTDYYLYGTKGLIEIIDEDLDKSQIDLDYNYKYYLDYGWHVTIIKMIAGFVALGLLAFTLFTIKYLWVNKNFNGIKED